MSEESNKKYILAATCASFILPISLMIGIFLYGFGSPESDSGAIQGFIYTVMLFPVIFIFQLVAYWVLGKSQLKRERPPVILGRFVGAVLATPLSLVFFDFGLSTGYSIFESIVLSVVIIFLPLWLSFVSGSSVQYYLMVKNA